MTARDFCYWLQGFFEINDAGLPGNVKVDKGLIGERVEMIKKHLAMVFLHEIDPSFPNQEELNKIHNKKPSKKSDNKPDDGFSLTGTQIRC